MNKNPDKPIFPVIIIDKFGYFDILYNDNDFSECNLLGLIKGFYKNMLCYDGFGNTWKASDVESKYKINQMTVFLANTIYNPKIKVNYKWKQDKKYIFDDLKKRIITLIKNDDDILTQYHEKAVLINLINRTNDFGELVKNIQKNILGEIK